MVRVIEYTVHAIAEDDTGETSEVFGLLRTVQRLRQRPGPPATRSRRKAAKRTNTNPETALNRPKLKHRIVI